MEKPKMSSTGSSTDKSSNNKEEEMMLPGFRFHPTDEELVGFYLRRKVEEKPISIELIKQVDIYKYDPWDLPKASTLGEKEWYFFCIRGRKYRNSIRPNRVTGSGFWKATGIDKPIYAAKEPHGCIGLKKSLVYYRGSAGKGTKTDWMMHEFRLPPNNDVQNTANRPILNPKSSITTSAPEPEVWTLCRIFKRIPSYKKYMPTDWKEPAATKQNSTDSSSKTGSFESDSSEKYLCFGDSSVHLENERKPVIDVQVHEANSSQMTNPRFESVICTQSPCTPPVLMYQSFWNSNPDDFFANGNWDELRTVVDQAATDPSQACDFR
ncbi:hypothetical protein K2173_019775 [Erythroxylum novogranatense]|uniref:NAC domain-containing protein n=1 Tax=Erythroxylum novogranatense TaxID=1862640 RepID=A0AAV8SN04_9ROSI|nr:hypothetical protein K2173_019775 [Erythroxylum novogranatense]